MKYKENNRLGLFFIGMMVSFFFISQVSAASSKNCLIIKELSSQKFLKKEGECDKRISPYSSFKIALSLMGFDTGILKDETTPTWLYEDRYNASFETWKLPHNPTTWMRDSCTWYSQRLTDTLGLSSFQYYVKKFQYGNQDISGDPGLNNGLSHAWLDSSLKISPIEQVSFLEKLLKSNLPVSKRALIKTKKILYIEGLTNGWALSGKTGTLYRVHADGTLYPDAENGWFVGWAEKDGRVLIFARLLQESPDTAEEAGSGGERAREEIKTLLTNM